MDHLAAFTDHLPPLARFALVLVLAMLVPFAARRLSLPDCVAFMLVGVVVGPHLLGIVQRDDGVASFLAELGKLLLMFFVGLEVDTRQFAAQRRRSGLFGLMTFALPMAAGTAVGLVFGYSVVSAVLIGSLLASHTLIAFPLVSAAGEAGRPSVAITVGATVLTDMLSLLVLAACLSIHRSGFDPAALFLEVVQLILFAGLMIYGLGIPARWIGKRLGDNQEARFIMLLVLVCAAATAAEAIELEGIIGAFLAGLAVNRAVEGTEARHRLEFVGRAFFIPAFFVATGFLVDVTVLAGTLVWQLPLVIGIVGGLVGAKWLAADWAGRLWGFAAAERGLMASLTMPQVAATLAAALVGYGAINAAGERLLDERMLNVVLVLVVATSILGPILTERYLRAVKQAR